jgi:hypothetical protein
MNAIRFLFPYFIFINCIIDIYDDFIVSQHINFLY